MVFMVTKIWAMKVNGRWWNMPLQYIGRKAVVECVSIILIFRVCHIHVQKGWQTIYIVFSDLSGICEISVYSCLVSDRLPSLKFKEVSLTGWGRHFKIIGTEKFCTWATFFFFYFFERKWAEENIRTQEEEVVVKWRKLHNEELYNLHSP